MVNSNFINVFGFVLCSLFRISYNLDHYDIDSLAVSCPERDKCSGYKHDKNFTERNCECDDNCWKYNDCCVDYRRQFQYQYAPDTTKYTTCLNIGENIHTGVYAIGNCSNTWRLSFTSNFVEKFIRPTEEKTKRPINEEDFEKVRAKCEGTDDFSNPLLDAPVTDIVRNITFKNIYCAQCNDFRKTGLKFFQIKLYCKDLQGISDKEILSDLEYSKWYKSWGVVRLHNENETKFHSCSIFYDAPAHLYRNLRFCRPNLVASCSRLWKNKSVEKRCSEYMAVVYDGSLVYRNAHCAFCNFKSVDEIVCKRVNGKGPTPHSLLLDFNNKFWARNSYLTTKRKRCPHRYRYGLLRKECRRLVQI